MGKESKEKDPEAALQALNEALQEFMAAIRQKEATIDKDKEE